jgi:hypothetical protein
MGAFCYHCNELPGSQNAENFLSSRGILHFFQTLNQVLRYWFDSLRLIKLKACFFLYVFQVLKSGHPDQINFFRDKLCMSLYHSTSWNFRFSKLQFEITNNGRLDYFQDICFQKFIHMVSLLATGGVNGGFLHIAFGCIKTRIAQQNIFEIFFPSQMFI